MPEPAPAPRFVLAPIHVDEALAPAALTAAGLGLGRDRANAIAVPAARFPGVSAHHARVGLDGDAPFVEDLGSRNGTWVNGERVQRGALAAGDVIELGPGGPRFALLAAAGPDETMAIPPDVLARRGAPRPLGTETMDLVRERLGIPADRKVEQMVRSTGRRDVALLVVVGLLLFAGGFLGFKFLERRGSEAVADLNARTAQLQRRIDQELERAQSEVEAQRHLWEEQGLRIDAARVAYEGDRQRLHEERARLESDIARLLADEKAAAGQLDALRAELERTVGALGLYDPVELEKTRLTRVSAVESAVVLIEAKVEYRSEKTGELLYLDEKADREIEPNFQGRGTPVLTESSGSGFCVDERGFVITNAHVIYKKEHRDQSIAVSDEFTLVPTVVLDVVFSGKSERHSARVVVFSSAGDDDLALLQIDPFPGMPHLGGLALDVPLPPRGSEVFLIGFPLGKQAMQQGDTVIASTFKGIVSRQLDQYLQVDAAVHPGASGGPLLDGNGTILGVVTAMQAVDEVAGSSAIGYVIPIARAAQIWPPKP